MTHILFARCPACRQGKITEGLFKMARRCKSCGYDLVPEDGYYVGSMMLGFVAAAILTIPPMLFLKMSGAEDRTLIIYPIVQYAILAPVLMFYSKVIWAHVGFRIRKKMDR